MEYYAATTLNVYDPRHDKVIAGNTDADARWPGLTVSAGLARGLIEFAVEKGASSKALAELSGIDPAELQDRDNRIPLQKYVALMRAAKELASDPALALHYGATVDMSAFSVVGLLFQTCETILEAINQINRYGQLVVQVDLAAPDRLQFQQRQGALWLADTRRDPNLFPELTEATFARFIGMTRRFWDTPFVTEVQVTHPAPSYADEYEKVFGAPTLFETDWNAMQIDESRLTYPIAQQPRYAFGILSEHANALLKSLEIATSFRGKVEKLSMPILHTGTATISTVASKFEISRQTVYRKLKAEGVTFEQVLDELRHKLALHYLLSERVSVSETAYLVGFSDRVAFSHAFKRWTGSTPGVYRR